MLLLNIGITCDSIRQVSLKYPLKRHERRPKEPKKDSGDRIDRLVSSCEIPLKAKAGTEDRRARPADL